MQNQESASNMVFKQLNSNTVENTDTIDQSVSINDTKNLFSKITKNSMGDRKSYKTVQITLTAEDKQNVDTKTKKKNIPVRHAMISNSYEQPSPKKDISQLKKRKIQSRQCLDNIFKHEPYIAHLKTFQPSEDHRICRILRDKHILDTEAELITKNEETIMAKKIRHVFSNHYEIISANQRVNTIGVMKSDFLGSDFNVYQKTESQQKLVATIHYDDIFTLNKTPKTVEMYVLRNDATLETVQGWKDKKMNLKDLYEDTDQGKKIVTKLKNRMPEKDPKNGFILNFGINNILPSVNNVILQEKDSKRTILKLYKVDENQFHLQINEGMSVFLAYCFALSSLVFKLTCQ